MSDSGDNHLLMFYVPVPDAETGRQLIKAALDSKRIACGNLLGPVRSFYEWQGEYKEETEFVIILKTLEKHQQDLVTLLKKRHPYECPCISFFPVSASPDFTAWVCSRV